MKPSAESAELKRCCAAVYESDFTRLLLGDSFHPGGLQLTSRLGELMGLAAGMRVLDVASGRGESAAYLAETFGCQVTGVDLGSENIRQASQRAAAAGIANLVEFQQGDAEGLPFPDGYFDAILCECAFCTFPSKETAAAEFGRVLKSGGVVGISDLTRAGELPAELKGLMAWIACIADARPVEEYVAYLSAANLATAVLEPCDDALSEMVHQVQGKLLGAELMAKLNKIDLAGIDLGEAKSLAQAASNAVKSGKLGYALLVARKGS